VFRRLHGTVAKGAYLLVMSVCLSVLMSVRKKLLGLLEGIYLNLPAQSGFIKVVPKQQTLHVLAVSGPYWFY